MKIQSLSVVVPASRCINNCKFCVAQMKEEPYPNMMSDNLPFFDLYLKDYLKRLEFARDNGCNTVMLTGNAEPQQNRKFLTYFGLFMQMLDNPFRKIEMQTTGVMIDENLLRFMRNHVGINTISLSVSSFDDAENTAIIGAKQEIRLRELCEKIKKYDFNLRLSLNMTKAFNMHTDKMFQTCKDLGADQVTIRVLYSSGNNTRQDLWIRENSADSVVIQSARAFIQLHDKLEVLEYGATKYSVYGMGVVLDSDCMAKDGDCDLKYLILRPNCKLYSKWDDEGSLIF